MLFTNPGTQLKVLIDERQLQQRVRDLGEQISLDYQGKHLHLICILKGACVFLADLIRHLPLDISIDFMAVSSYANSLHTSGEVKIIKDLDSIIQGSRGDDYRGYSGYGLDAGLFDAQPAHAGSELAKYLCSAQQTLPANQGSQCRLRWVRNSRRVCCGLWLGLCRAISKLADDFSDEKR